MFGKEKESKEFFEVFKKPHEEVKCDSEALRRKQENPTVIPRPEKKRKQVVIDENKSEKQMGWIKDTHNEEEFQPGEESVGTFQPREKKKRRLFSNEVVIKQETLVFGALGAVFLSLACFFFGYKIGDKDVLNPEMLQESVIYSELEGEVKSVPQGREIKAVDLSTKTPSAISDIKANDNVQWTLQIISYSNTKQHLQKARNLAKAIKNMTNYNTFVAKRGKELVVCMGKFNSKDSDEIKRALVEISKLEYEGKKQFASSYPIQIR